MTFESQNSKIQKQWSIVLLLDVTLFPLVHRIAVQWLVKQKSYLILHFAWYLKNNSNTSSIVRCSSESNSSGSLSSNGVPNSNRSSTRSVLQTVAE